MQRVLPVAVLALVVGSTFALSLLQAQDDKPKHTIKDVMKKAQAKTGLLNKVTGGTASKEEKAELVELYTALGKNKPPKGEASSWKEKTDAILAAAKEAQEGKGTDKLKSAAGDCKGCHSVHK